MVRCRPAFNSNVVTINEALGLVDAATPPQLSPLTGIRQVL